MDDPTKDTIPRSAVEYCLRKETVSTNPEKYKTHEKFIDYMNDPDISEFGHWMHSNGFNCALTTISVDLKKIPSVTPPAQPGQRNARVFQGIIVEYPSISAYPEYEGKPYFSIKYTENGQEFIGYGTYKPEVLSEYLKEYFMPPTQPRWIPVTERLPEEDTEVLVTVYFMGLKQTSPSGWNDHIRPNYYVDLASRIGDEWSSASDEYKVAQDRHKVVAWIEELPKPWEGGQS